MVPCGAAQERLMNEVDWLPLFVYSLCILSML